MFSLKDIEEAHLKVKSGEDFPNYIKEILNLGVVRYQTFVADGCTKYFDVSNTSINSSTKYNTLEIQKKPNLESFKNGLISHQKGDTDYPSFIKMCAENGISNWVVDVLNKTCTYFDNDQNTILTEKIPI